VALPIDKTAALIIVDMQNDFLPGGAAAVPKGDEIIGTLNQYAGIFMAKSGAVFATRDWHPMHHISFKERGGLWPAHCIQNTKGADFHPKLKLPFGVEIISKAFLVEKDAYSAFEGTELKRRLDHKVIQRVFVGGVATEQCVKNTVLDAIRRGFETYLLADAIQGIEARSGDVARAMQTMVGAGAIQIFLKDIQ